MAQESQVRNPFMLMIEPEVVLAAIENSERLGRLNRHLCRPLDRVATPAQAGVVAEAEDAVDDVSDDAH
jgi:hypothetical protein